MLASIACSPADSDPEAEVEVEGSSGADDASAAPECVESSDCGSGEECVEGACSPCPYTDQEGMCCPFPECQAVSCESDGECGLGELCSASSWCEGVPALQECAAVPELSALVLPEHGTGPIISLSIVRVDEDRGHELIIGRAGGSYIVSLFAGTSVELPLATEAPVLDAAAADLDGDGIAEVLIADADGVLTVLLQDGAGGYELASEMAIMATQIETLHWDADDAVDLVVVDALGQAMIHLGDGGGDFMASMMLPMETEVVSLGIGSMGLDDYDDIVVQDTGEGRVLRGSASGTIEPVEPLAGVQQADGQRKLLVGDFDGAGSDDVVGFTETNGWVLLDQWHAGVDAGEGRAVFNRGSLGAVGDVDADGAVDAVLVAEDVATLVLGMSGDEEQALLSCQATVALEQPASLLEVGDLDGDEFAEIVVSDGIGLTVLSGS